MTGSPFTYAGTTVNTTQLIARIEADIRALALLREAQARRARRRLYLTTGVTTAVLALLPLVT